MYAGPFFNECKVRSCGLGRISGTRILLNHNPTIEMVVAQNGKDFRDIGCAGSDRREHDLPKRLEKREFPFLSLGYCSRIDVFEVQVPDLSDVVANKLLGITTSVDVVTSVKAQVCR